MLLIPEKIHMGAINVVSNMNNIEIPSIPKWKIMNPLIQSFFSTNWNSDVEESKENQRKIESKKFAREEKIATYFKLFTTIFCSPLVIEINKAPISGINMIAERIGKFI